MIPIGAILVGLGLLVAGALVLRSFGSGYRIARLLAATLSVSIEEAVALARSGQRSYVRITGRIDSDEDFPDEHGRPLVARRVRVDIQRSGRWATVSDERRSVPFVVREGLAEIAVAHASIWDGLVVLDRESVGVAADAPGVVPDGLAGDTPVRVRVHQLSSVEHATVLGVPALGSEDSTPRAGRDDGTPVVGPGNGRPLIVSVLERDEAMQLLAAGRRGRARFAAVLLVAGLGFLGLGLAAGALTIVGAAPATLAAPYEQEESAGGVPGAPTSPGPATSEAAAASTAPTPATSAPAGEDTRSSGEGVGLAGSPLLAIAAVLALGVVAAIATLLYVRLTGGPREAA